MLRTKPVSHIVSALVLTAAMSMVATAAAPTAQADSFRDRYDWNSSYGMTWYPGGWELWSSDHRTHVVFQVDGNLVLYKDGVASWQAGTYGRRADRIAFQTDGHVVVYAGSSPLWASGYWDPFGLHGGSIFSLYARGSVGAVYERFGNPSHGEIGQTQILWSFPN